MQKLFTYGMLQDAKVQENLFGRILIGSSDALPDYERAVGVIEIEGGKYDVAKIKPGSKIDGVVYELNEVELKIADKYEGKDYERIKVKLLSGIESWVYAQSKL